MNKEWRQGMRTGNEEQGMRNRDGNGDAGIGKSEVKSK